MKRLVPAVVATSPTSLRAFADIKVVGGLELRDWEAMDTNDDRYVSSDEMEAFLQDIRDGGKRCGEA